MYAHARALSRSFSRRRQLISKLISQPVPRQSACSFALLHTRLHEHLYFNRKTPSRPLYRLVSRCRGHESSCQPAATSRPPRVSVFALLIGRWRRWWRRDSAAVCPSRWPLVSPSARPNEGGVGAGGVPFFLEAHVKERATKLATAATVFASTQPKGKRRRITLM